MPGVGDGDPGDVVGPPARVDGVLVDRAFQVVTDGTLPPGSATDDGVGLVHRGTELAGAVADRAGAAAYRVERGPDGRAAVSIEPRRLPRREA